MEFELGVYVNGALQESCNAGNTTINVLRHAAAASIRDGVTYVYQCHSGGSMDEFASFLIGAYTGAFWVLAVESGQQRICYTLATHFLSATRRAHRGCYVQRPLGIVRLGNVVMNLLRTHSSVTFTTTWNIMTSN